MVTAMLPSLFFFWVLVSVFLYSFFTPVFTSGGFFLTASRGILRGARLGIVPRWGHEFSPTCPLNWNFSLSDVQGDILLFLSPLPLFVLDSLTSAASFFHSGSVHFLCK